jgi:hypothetical protein
MLDVPARRRNRGRSADAVLEYSAPGWACCPGAHPLRRGSRACSCDRVGCPAPGAHPLSLAWQIQATPDASVLRRWWEKRPDAGIILPTGRVFDVFDAPMAAAELALSRIERGELPLGPVARLGSERGLFFVATRGTPDDEDEWWSSDLDVRSSAAGTCHIDGGPEAVAGAPGLRWHCRDSYVVAPPSRLPKGGDAAWLRPPNAADSLPDPLVLLEVLADACAETAAR